MKFVRKAIIAVLCTASLTAIAQSQQVAIASSKATSFASQMAPIKSQIALANYMAMTPGSGNPLMKLSPATRQQFIDSLSFNENGVTGYRYDGLERELNATQIRKLLSLLGIQESGALLKKVKEDSSYSTATCYDPVYDNFCNGVPSKDYQNMRCANRGSCKPEESWVCTSNC
jgi:hypothetical protein